MRAKARTEPQLVPGTARRWTCWILCDECPDEFYGLVLLEDDELFQDGDEYTVQGSCWDSGLKEQECPHLVGMGNDGNMLWIKCDSAGWDKA